MISFSQGSQRILVVVSAGRDVGHPWTVPAGLSLSWLLDFNAGVQDAYGGSR